MPLEQFIGGGGIVIADVVSEEFQLNEATLLRLRLEVQPERVIQTVERHDAHDQVTLRDIADRLTSEQTTSGSSAGVPRNDQRRLLDRESLA